MRRAVGVGNLLEALAWGAVAGWLYEGWPTAGVIAGAAALLQVAGGFTLLLGHGGGVARIASALTLAAAGALVALYAQATLVIATRFGAEARDIGLATFGGAMAGLPWLVGFPLWQVLATRKRGAPGGVGTLGLVLAASGLGWGGGALASQPAQTWPEQPALLEAARGAFARWTGADPEAPLPVGEGPALVLLTPWLDGRPGESIRADGPNLGEAVQTALRGLPAAGARPALVLDLARERWDGRAPHGPGSGALVAGGGRSPVSEWRPPNVERVDLLPGLRGPRAKGKGDTTRFDSALVDAEGARALVDGWPAGPALSAEAAREAALEGARMLVRHQDEQGRYAYIIAGPSGRELGGYNFPRHAGVSWFLARVVERTGDARVAAGLARGLAYLQASSGALPDGSSYVRDPSRPDRKVWVGTTALAVLAAVSARHEAALPWGRFVAASVDAEGKVRGELDLDQQRFPDQPRNPYGQGQAMLALAALVRAGHEEFRAPLLRAMDYVDGAYAPLAAGRLVVLDEHWACLATLAAREATGRTAGWELCRAYVASAAFDTPTPGSAAHLGTGAAGGLAEAVVAAAVLDPEGPWRARALDFASLFLEKAFRPADAPLLEQPLALQGGFRDGTADWDVRMDAVQHIGCALLGAEALLDGPQPGSLP